MTALPSLLHTYVSCCHPHLWHLDRLRRLSTACQLCPRVPTPDAHLMSHVARPGEHSSPRRRAPLGAADSSELTKGGSFGNRRTPGHSRPICVRSILRRVTEEKPGRRSRSKGLWPPRRPYPEFFCCPLLGIPGNSCTLCMYIPPCDDQPQCHSKMMSYICTIP